MYDQDEPVWKPGACWKTAFTGDNGGFSRIKVSEGFSSPFVRKKKSQSGPNIGSHPGIPV